jgi:hypothetical protein
MSRARKTQIIVVRPQAGGGFFDDVNKWLKKTKIISTGLGAIAPVLPGGYGIAAGGVGGLAKQLGYGKPRRKGRKPGPKPKKAPAKRRPRRK